MSLYLIFSFQRKHPEVFKHLGKPAAPASQQPTNTTMDQFVKLQKWSRTDARQQELTGAIVGFVTSDLMPLSIVESKAFRHLMGTAQPQFTMPSRKHLREKLIPESAGDVMKDLLSKLDKTENLALTLDIWTSRDMRSFIGITGHFVEDYHLNNIMLACHRLTGSHTAENIHESYTRTVETFAVQAKVGFIVTDNAANMIKAFSLPGFDVLSDSDSDLDTVDITDQLDYLPPSRLSCFAHTLQLVVKGGLKDTGQIKAVLSKAAGLVSYVHRSTAATEILQGHCKLEPANATRWNSQVKMLRSILRVPEDIIEQLDYSGKPTKYERKVMQEVCDILQPFEEATDRVQGDKVVTASLFIVMIRGLWEELSILRETYNCRLVSTLQASLDRRLSKYEDMPCMKLAAVLDPRFKLDWCNDDEVTDVKQLLTEQLPMASTSELCRSEEPPHKRSRLLSFMKGRSSMPARESDTSDYLNEPCIPENDDPLRFWCDNQARFLLLSRLAKKYLAIPASSAPVERLFSVAGKIFRPERCRLTDDVFEDMMLLRCNRPWINCAMDFPVLYVWLHIHVCVYWLQWVKMSLLQWSCSRPTYVPDVL